MTQGDGGFLERLFGDLLQMLEGGTGGRGSGAKVDLAKSFAHGVAAAGEPEVAADPLDRIAMEELLRVAELHVTEITGLGTPGGEHGLDVVAVTPSEWAVATMDDWRFLLESMSAAPGVPGLAPGSAGAPGPASFEDLAALLSQSGLGSSELVAGTDEPESPAAAQEMLARMFAGITPMLAALQLGSAVGHLGRSTMGQYELPIPRQSATRLLFVPANLDRFVADWSLETDQVRLWTGLRELTTHLVLSRPHVAARLRELLGKVTGSIAQDAAGMVQHLEHLDPTDPTALNRLLGDPTALADTDPSPERRRAMDELSAITATLLGYVEHVIDQAGLRLLGGRSPVAEAWRRRQVAREPADRATEMMLGMDLSPGQIERGTQFVTGVLERASEAGLARLWESARTLPTPAEVDAPGLWLERIAIADTDGADTAAPDPGDEGHSGA